MEVLLVNVCGSGFRPYGIFHCYFLPLEEAFLCHYTKRKTVILVEYRSLQVVVVLRRSSIKAKKKAEYQDPSL